MTIFIPTPLRAFTADKDAVEVKAATIAQDDRDASDKTRQ